MLHYMALRSLQSSRTNAHLSPYLYYFIIRNSLTSTKYYYMIVVQITIQGTLASFITLKRKIAVDDVDIGFRK